MIASACSKRRSAGRSPAGQASSAASGLARRLRAPLDRAQCTEGSRIALPAPVGQRRRVKAFAAQDGTDPTVGGAVGLAKDAQLVCAVNVRRRGRSDSSGDAATGAGTTVGLRPSSVRRQSPRVSFSFFGA